MWGGAPRGNSAGMSSEPDPAELEKEGQREADKLEEPSKKLSQQVEDVSQDWKSKRSDEGVPGAPMPEDDESGDDEDEDESGRDEGDEDSDSEDEDTDSEDEDSDDDEDSKSKDDQESDDDQDSGEKNEDEG